MLKERHANTRLKKSSIMHREDGDHRTQLGERSVELACGLVSTTCTKLVTDRSGENGVKIRILARRDLREVVSPLGANIERTAIRATWGGIGATFHGLMGNKTLLWLTPASRARIFVWWIEPQGENGAGAVRESSVVSGKPRPAVIEPRGLGNTSFHHRGWVRRREGLTRP